MEPSARRRSVPQIKGPVRRLSYSQLFTFQVAHSLVELEMESDELLFDVNAIKELMDSECSRWILEVDFTSRAFFLQNKDKIIYAERFSQLKQFAAPEEDFGDNVILIKFSQTQWQVVTQNSSEKACVMHLLSEVAMDHGAEEAIALAGPSTVGLNKTVLRAGTVFRKARIWESQESRFIVIVPGKLFLFKTPKLVGQHVRYVTSLIGASITVLRGLEFQISIPGFKRVIFIAVNLEELSEWMGALEWSIRAAADMVQGRPFLAQGVPPGISSGIRQDSFPGQECSQTAGTSNHCVESSGQSPCGVGESQASLRSVGSSLGSSPRTSCAGCLAPGSSHPPTCCVHQTPHEPPFFSGPSYPGPALTSRNSFLGGGEIPRPYLIGGDILSCDIQHGSTQNREKSCQWGIKPSGACSPRCSLVRNIPGADHLSSSRSQLHCEHCCPDCHGYQSPSHLSRDYSNISTGLKYLRKAVNSLREFNDDMDYFLSTLGKNARPAMNVRGQLPYHPELVMRGSCVSCPASRRSSVSPPKLGRASMESTASERNSISGNGSVQGGEARETLQTVEEEDGDQEEIELPDEAAQDMQSQDPKGQVAEAEEADLREDGEGEEKQEEAQREKMSRKVANSERPSLRSASIRRSTNQPQQQREKMSLRTDLGTSGNSSKRMSSSSGAGKRDSLPNGWSVYKTKKGKRCAR